MDHAQANAMFSAMLDGELKPEEQRELDEHLKTCVVCRREWQQLERAVREVRQLPHEEAPPAFVEGVVDRLRRRSGGRFFAPRRTDRVPYELFSLLMLAVILGIYLAIQLSSPSSVNIP